MKSSRFALRQWILIAAAVAIGIALLVAYVDAITTKIPRNRKPEMPKPGYWRENF